MWVRYSCNSVSTRKDSRRRARLTAMITTAKLTCERYSVLKADDDAVLDDRVEPGRHGEQGGHHAEVAGALVPGAAVDAVDRVAEEPERDERERVGHVLQDVRRGVAS